MNWPKIIQGGMGVGVSNWRLAQAVSEAGQLGVVSGTALDQVLARRLQDGDPGGHMRRALKAFPVASISQRVFESFYVPGGLQPGESYKKMPMPVRDAARESIELYMAANFVEVFLAREGHGNAVGINYLEKLQIPHLPSIYGAMLAGVEYVLMGAGIPSRIPGVLDRLARHEAVEYPLQVTGALEGDDTMLRFDPGEYMGEYVDVPLADLVRPFFLAIVASNTLAASLLKRSKGRVDGFVVEAPEAGGHNAPPRGKLQLSEAGEPIYGERDRVDFAKMRELGVPFWLAGGYGSSGKLREAVVAGAAGIQVGTAFAFCSESGLREEYKREILGQVASGGARVFTDPLASPTGFPFKVVAVAGTASEADCYEERPRVCDLGYLREAYRMASGEIGYRCPGEPLTVYLSKGGTVLETVGRKCLCNGLMANIGHAQVRAGKHVEPALVTAGDDLAGIARFGLSYSAADAIRVLSEG